ncbi:hypothetical protein [Candidatus Thiosymbion oneisti]|uniref:hypothetical protein n=1 Tax=Candidatus Thiosymbion oneisti TaxID=589554 RepID=UPI0013FDD8C5|nr:hypothetical protein [Candidatus Thiosymbion oneisti]
MEDLVATSSRLGNGVGCGERWPQGRGHGEPHQWMARAQHSVFRVRHAAYLPGDTHY